MFKSIQSEQDIKEFLAQTNYLHDGYLLAVQYANNGVSVNNDEYTFDFEKTKLILRILVTSIFDTVIEIEFIRLAQIKKPHAFYASRIMGGLLAWGWFTSSTGTLA